VLLKKLNWAFFASLSGNGKQKCSGRCRWGIVIVGVVDCHGNRHRGCHDAAKDPRVRQALLRNSKELIRVDPRLSEGKKTCVHYANLSRK